jgi:hypothetical protein
MVAAAKPLRRNSTCSSKKKTTTLWRRKSVLKSTLESLKYVKGMKCECAVQIASNQYHGHLKKKPKKNRISPHILDSIRRKNQKSCICQDTKKTEKLQNAIPGSNISSVARIRPLTQANDLESVRATFHLRQRKRTLSGSGQVRARMHAMN